jgi:hypothetical protein
MPSQNEVSLLRDQITEEVSRDAEVIGNQLFGQQAAAREPDVSNVSEDQLRAMYRQKLQQGDRDWLASEATRDPRQFLRVAEGIGMQLPENLPAAALPPELAPPAAEQAIAPPSPMAALASPAVPPPAAAPVMPAPAPAVPPAGAMDPSLVTAALAAIQQQQAAAPPGPFTAPSM